MSTFTRDGQDEWDDGWSRVPHGLWTLDVPAGAKVLLGWLHSHTEPFLAKLSMNSCRKAMGTSQIVAWFDALETAGLVQVERADNGKPAKILLLMAKWRSLIGNRADIGAPTSPISARIEEQGEDQPSSLRSEDQRAGQVAKDYYDWYTLEHVGKKPTIEFMALRAVAKRLIKSGHADDDIIDAMKSSRTWTAKSLAAEIARKKAEADQRPATVAIPHALVKAFTKAGPFFDERRIAGRAMIAALMRICARAMANHGLDVGETMLRLAVVVRNVGDEMATDDELYLAVLRCDQVDRFAGELADYPDAMRRAYTNRYWRAS